MQYPFDVRVQTVVVFPAELVLIYLKVVLWNPRFFFVMLRALF